MQVVLRRPSSGDAEQRAKLGRHPDVLIGYGVVADAPREMSLEDAKQWMNNIVENPYAWIIEFEKRVIGLVRLDNVDQFDKRANLAIGIEDHNLLGKGLGAQAVRACLKIAFDEIKLHRVAVRVLEANHRARRCYEKCGFVVEGVEREAAFVQGKRENDVIMGILAHEF